MSTPTQKLVAAPDLATEVRELRLVVETLTQERRRRERVPLPVLVMVPLAAAGMLGWLWTLDGRWAFTGAVAALVAHLVTAFVQQRRADRPKPEPPQEPVSFAELLQPPRRE